MGFTNLFRPKSYEDLKVELTQRRQILGEALKREQAIANLKRDISRIEVARQKTQVQPVIKQIASKIRANLTPSTEADERWKKSQEITRKLLYG